MFDVLVNFGLFFYFFIFFFFSFLLFIGVCCVIHLYYDDCIYLYIIGDISWIVHFLLLSSLVYAISLCGEV